MKPIIFKVLFTITAYHNFDINQMDMKTVFFFKPIDQLVNVLILEDSESSTNKNMVCKLLKKLYGLKQVFRLWYKKLSIFFFKKLGLQQINADYSIFLFTIEINGLIVSMFVDDIKIMRAKNLGIISRVKEKLMVAFEMIDIEPISFYLSLKISWD